ncbi:hypothetical protein [Sedimenticola hydrogenitrophicus]|uniref:hypothetical protein n=1 Tax=Sedimenticola hydrogenitrophicus TaxID=2967975 RepID=UPI0021A95F57|nr:hypothetical protein [Sedimenticola hydrogenitrophicus]
MQHRTIALLLGIGALCGSFPLSAEQRPMGFFVTSVGMGDGANLGGLAGADAHCQKLASAAGAGEREWRAYLSTEEKDKRGIFARERIGNGPWYNARSMLIGANLTDLHLYNNKITLETALDENGNRIKGRYDKPNEHDILTGTQDDGTAYFPDDTDHTCNNWTSNGEGSAQVGHHDRHGGGNASWTSAHPTRGCGKDDLPKTGGNGYFYCFAAD